MPENVPRFSGQDTVLSIVKWRGSLLSSVVADLCGLCSQLWLKTALSWPVRLCSTVSLSLLEKPGTWAGSHVNLIGKTASNHPMYLIQLLHFTSSWNISYTLKMEALSFSEVWVHLATTWCGYQKEDHHLMFVTHFLYIDNTFFFDSLTCLLLGTNVFMLLHRNFCILGVYSAVS